MKRVLNNLLKFEYETLTGQKISIATWYRVKNAITENKLEVNLDTIRLVASIKNSVTKSKIDLNNVINIYITISNFEPNAKFKGSNVFRDIQKITQNKCSNRTILRWFSSVPKDSKGYRFNSDRFYSPKELQSVFIKACSFKIKHKL
jgi:hypothetical protein